jgi:hypothetical protein
MRRLALEPREAIECRIQALFELPLLTPLEESMQPVQPKWGASNYSKSANMQNHA